MVQDDKLTILSQMFWIAVSLLESDFDHEFAMAVRLLEKVGEITFTKLTTVCTTFNYSLLSLYKYARDLFCFI